MYDNVNRVERDAAGNYWFLSDLFGRRSKWKVYYDMTNNLDKAGALVSCTPFFTVVDKIGSMMSRGIPYVVDKDGNEKGHLPIYVIYSTLPIRCKHSLHL